MQALSWPRIFCFQSIVEHQIRRSFHLLVKLHSSPSAISFRNSIFFCYPRHHSKSNFCIRHILFCLPIARYYFLRFLIYNTTSHNATKKTSVASLHFRLVTRAYRFRRKEKERTRDSSISHSQ